MSRLFWALVWIVVLVFVAPRLVVGAEPASLWRTDFDSALREAEQKKLPLIMHFYADWCMPCQKMESTVFANSTVREALTTRFVAVKLNSETNQHLVRRYGFEILPTDMAIDPLTGRVLAMHSGYMDQSAYMKLALQTEANFRKAHPVPPRGEPEGTRPNADGPDGSELGEPQLVVGLNGFSPVAITKSRKWVRGSAKFGWDYKGVTYHLASRDELLEFRKSPESYAPKMLGCDPVILWETDRAIAGTPDFAAFYDDELYLFKTDERRKQFKANPEKFTKLQQALKADQIERTAMR
ncbi:MAG: thioredoxin family protein [Planctomycetes bacterium]|nr:thioredoxin family protein [Planctomycetota bacterium]